MKVNDYSAELIVASRFAEAGWNIYFPHRDEGFDFIVSKTVEGVGEVIRPVQVKGKYPTDVKTDKATYGYMGVLSKVHPEMVLAMPFLNPISNAAPIFIAYLPMTMVRPCAKGYRCHPATFKKGSPRIRSDYDKIFDDSGLMLLELIKCKDSGAGLVNDTDGEE
mgnify:CR=1 FL=1